MIVSQLDYHILGYQISGQELLRRQSVREGLHPDLLRALRSRSSRIFHKGRIQLSQGFPRKVCRNHNLSFTSRTELAGYLSKKRLTMTFV